jgi:flavin reductase (DIM6/NTAB) family NADH-FMN oxidoreductase RutF
MLEIDPSQYLKWTYVLNPIRAFIVTCVDEAGKANAVTISWVMPVSYTPPIIVISVGHQRYSHRLIAEKGEFVVNVPTMELLREIEYCGRRSGRDLEKFKESGLTPLPAKKVKPPIIKECIAWIECKVRDKTDAGDHTLFLGDVASIYVREEIFQEKMYDTRKAKMILHIGKERYVTTSDEIVEVHPDRAPIFHPLDSTLE